MANTEREITIYARVGDPDGLNQADAVEQHEQWEVRLPVIGENGAKRRQRVRETISDGVSRFDETIKIDIDGETAVQSTIEVSTPIEAAYFEAWKQHFGERGVLKTRYTFHAKKVSVSMEDKEIEIPNIKYEVDIFRTETGERSRWCKIDVEIDSLLDFLDRKGISFDDVEMVVKVTHLPFKPEQCFLHSAGNEQHDQSVKKFWDAFQLKKKESNNGR
jgi:hypothetical protein